jgi:acetyltransferase-like isoleucine patch superfamily enzyme
MKFGGCTVVGRIATRLALIPVEPFRHRYRLATLYHHGFTAPDAMICKTGFVRGKFVYIGSRVIFFRQRDGGEIIIGNEVYLNDAIRFETGSGGGIEIGDGTHIQTECQFSAYTGNIKVGKNVQIAPRCAFYPYDHGISLEKSMMEQPIVSKGGIKVKEGALLGYGVIVLDGVTIGEGAVVGAGSVVKDDIPDYAISAGIPAKIIKMRE